MPELPTVEHVADPLAGLRAATAAHAAVVDASKRTGAEVQAEKQQAPTAATVTA